MRKQLFAHLAKGGEGLGPLIIEAAAQIRKPKAEVADQFRLPAIMSPHLRQAVAIGLKKFGCDACVFSRAAGEDNTCAHSAPWAWLTLTLKGNYKARRQG